MYFRMRRDARDWFKDIRKSLEVDFDVYYFCMMAGIASGKKKTESMEMVDLVDNYPGPYHRRGRLLIGLLIREELRSLGISLRERDSVNKLIRTLIKSDSPSYLSDEGARLMNSYSCGGFEELVEHFGDRPRTLETFLRTYHKYLSETREKREKEEKV